MYRRRSEPIRAELLIGGLFVAIAIVAGGYYLLRDREPEPLAVEPPAAGETLEAPERAAPATPDAGLPSAAPSEMMPAPVLPALDESDAFVRESLAAMALPEAWIGRDDLIRRTAVVVDNAVKGEYPRQQLGFLAPTGKFQVVNVGDRLFVDPVSYARYDGYVDLLEAIPPQTLAGWLETMQPLIGEALAELGNEVPVGTQLGAVIDLLLAVPVIDDEIELVQPKVVYEYADPRLEALKPIQKQVLRMGPDNVRRIKAYLEALRDALVGASDG